MPDVPFIQLFAFLTMCFILSSDHPYYSVSIFRDFLAGSWLRLGCLSSMHGKATRSRCTRVLPTDHLDTVPATVRLLASRETSEFLEEWCLVCQGCVAAYEATHCWRESSCGSAEHSFQIATFQQCWPALFVLTCGERPFISSQQVLAESTDFLKEKAEVVNHNFLSDSDERQGWNWGPDLDSKSFSRFFCKLGVWEKIQSLSLQQVMPWICFRINQYVRSPSSCRTLLLYCAIKLSVYFSNQHRSWKL